MGRMFVLSYESKGKNRWLVQGIRRKIANVRITTDGKLVIELEAKRVHRVELAAIHNFMEPFMRANKALKRAA